MEELGLDSSGFDISRVEARSMDPQQVFVLQAGYIALVDGSIARSSSGRGRSTLEHAEIGVFVGVEPSGLVLSQTAHVFSASGGALSITSGRLSFVLGLVGPCYSFDTACSSALAALHVCVTSM